MGLKPYSPAIYGWASKINNMSQVYSKIYYHLVWATKCRLPLINEATESWLRKFIPKKIINNQGRLLEMNMVEDHIHLLVSISPNLSVSDFVNIIKGSSSYHINLMKREKSFYWQPGYSVLSISEKGIIYVREYIKNQKIKHKKRDLLDILEFISN